MDFLQFQNCVFYPTISNKILKDYPEKTVFISTHYTAHFYPAFCDEHHTDELIPRFQYEFDLRPWYEAKKHPRFSLLAIFKKYERNVYAVHNRRLLLRELLQKIDNEEEFEKLVKERYILIKGIQKYVLETQNPTERDLLEVRNFKELKILLKKVNFDLLLSFLQKQGWLICHDNEYTFFLFQSTFYKFYTRTLPVYLMIHNKNKKIIRKYSKFDTKLIEQNKLTPTELLKMEKELNPVLWRAFCDGNERVFRYYTNQLTIDDIFKEYNHEIRRHFFTKINVDELVSRLTKIDENERGKLYKFFAYTNLLYVVCPSTNTPYLLQVPSYCNTVKSALNWTFNFNDNDDVEILRET